MVDVESVVSFACIAPLNVPVEPAIVPALILGAPVNPVALPANLVAVIIPIVSTSPAALAVRAVPT